MRAFGGWLVAAGMLVSGVAAAGPPRIALHASPTTRLTQRTREAIRIQLSDVGVVDDDSASDTAITVHIEHSRPSDLVVTVTYEDRVIVRLLELPTAARGEVDRAIALKIAELVDEVMRPRVDAPIASQIDMQIETPFVPRVTAASPARPHPIEEQLPRYIAELGLVGLVGADQIGMQTALHVAAGVQWHGDNALLETVASVRVGPEAAVTTSNGSLVVDDASAMLGARIFTTHSTIAVGAHADIGVRRLEVSGIAPDGRTGRAVARALAAAPGIDVRWHMSSRLEMRASVSALLTFDRPVFSLDGMATVDVAALSAVTTMSLVLLVP